MSRSYSHIQNQIKVIFPSSQNILKILYTPLVACGLKTQLIQVIVLQQCRMCLKLDGPKNMLMFFFMQYTLY